MSLLKGAKIKASEIVAGTITTDNTNLLSNISFEESAKYWKEGKHYLGPGKYKEPDDGCEKCLGSGIDPDCQEYVVGERYRACECCVEREHWQLAPPEYTYMINGQHVTLQPGDTLEIKYTTDLG